MAARSHTPNYTTSTEAIRGTARVMPVAEIERWCEIVAAMQARTTNRKGRCLSVARVLELLVDHGVEAPDGLQKLAPDNLTASTLNRHMRRLGYDRDRMTREPAAVRYHAEHANDLWHFDMNPSDLKQLERPPPWVDLAREGNPTLMLFSAVDDRSGSFTRSTAACSARRSRPRCASCSRRWHPS